MMIARALRTVVTAFLASAAIAAAQSVWTTNPLTTIYQGPDYADKNDPKCAIELDMARNGVVSGEAIFSFKEPAKAPDATMSDLKQDGGSGTIPAGAVQIRYALPTGVNGGSRLPAGHTAIFDALAESLPDAQSQVWPVWVTVNVPSNAAPGIYAGTLTAAGQKVPVKLTVAAWTLPNPQDFTTFVDFMESPESVAYRYDVPLWSDRHFELIGTVFRQLARIGNKTIRIPLAGKCNLGDEHTMIRWIKTDKEKVFQHDFVPLEKYLDVALKNGIRPAVVMAHVYEDFYGGSQAKGGVGGVLVDLLDPATGKTETMEGPGHNNQIEGWPDYPAQHYAFWNPVFNGMLERMKARGIPDTALGMGLSRDMMPGKPTLVNLKIAAPCAGWVSHSHGERFGMHGMRGAYCTTVWNARFPKDASENFRGWKRPQIVLHNDRDIWKPEFSSQLVRSRILGELNIVGKQRGFGRMSSDFWPCLKNPKGHLYGLASRFPKSDWVQLNLRQTPYLYPGPNGAISTIRYEMMIEGIQECEARIFIERALLDAAQKAKLGEEFAAGLQTLLSDRVAAFLGSIKKGKSEGLAASDAGFAEGGWRESSRQLYAAAAKVAAALEK